MNIELHMENVWCLHIFVAERHLRTVAILFEYLIFLRKTGRHKMILQLSECLSTTSVCEQNTFPMCDFMFMQHNSHSEKVSLFKFKNLQVHKFTDYPYLYGESLKW